MAKPNDPPLRRSDAVEAALALIDRDGLAGFTIRKLAKELDIAAPTLYYHFASKDELLRDVGQMMIAGMRPSEAPPDPVDAIVVHSRDYYRVLVEHPSATQLIGPEFRRANTLRWYEYLVTLIENAGIPTADAVSVCEALDGLLQGLARAASTADPDMDAFRRGDHSEFPHLRNAVAADAYTDEGRLDKAVRALLRGWIIDADSAHTRAAVPAETSSV